MEVIEEAIAPGRERTDVDIDLPAADYDLFHPQGFALEFGWRLVEIFKEYDKRLSGGCVRLGWLEAMVLERQLNGRALLRP